MRFLVLVLAVFPLPAFALSCMPHGVPHAFQEAAAAEEGYVPVLGQLEFDPDLLPPMDLSGQTDVPPVTFPVWLTCHRELHTSRRIRLVYDFLAEALSAKSAK